MNNNESVELTKNLIISNIKKMKLFEKIKYFKELKNKYNDIYVMIFYIWKKEIDKNHTITNIYDFQYLEDKKLSVCNSVNKIYDYIINNKLDSYYEYIDNFIEEDIEIIPNNDNFDIVYRTIVLSK